MLIRKGILKFSNSFLHENFAKVATWNALASSFNVAPQKKYNFWSQNVGLFEIPQLSTPEGFKVLKDEAIQNSWKLVEKAATSKPGEETIVLLDELSDTLCRVADMADFVRCAHPNRDYAEAAADTHLSIGTLVEELNTCQDLYESLKKVTDNPEVMSSLDEETRTVADLFMFDFTISGIHLSSTQRQKAVQLHEELLQLTAHFLQLSNSPMSFSKNQIPSPLHRFFNQDEDNIIVNGLQCDNADEVVREAAHRLHYYFNSQTESLLSRLLQVRQEVARLVGFESFAERTLKSTIAKSPETVMAFLQSLSEKLMPLAKEELAELALLKSSAPSNNKPIMPWDLHYYTGKMRAQKNSIDPYSYCAYFSLGDCMDGLNYLFKALFDVTVTAVPTQKGEIWNNDVVKLAVNSAHGLLGYIYCDFFNRPGKPQQDCHFTIRGGRRLRDGSYQAPVVVLMLHLPSPSYNQTPLLTPSAMNNLFHEMGHAMHSMLARTRYQHVTGTRCATDFAEVPSVLMEYFARDPRVLSVFAKHHKTREALSPDMIKSLCDAENMSSPTEMQTQVHYAIADQSLHGTLDFNRATISEVITQIHTDHCSLPFISNTAWHHRFSHLASYGAKYYSYMMSRAVASRIWNKCFVKDPFNREMGLRFRNEMLQHGGGKDPVVMYQNMMQENFDANKLVSTLIDEVH